MYLMKVPYQKQIFFIKYYALSRQLTKAKKKKQYTHLIVIIRSEVNESETGYLRDDA